MKSGSRKKAALRTYGTDEVMFDDDRAREGTLETNGLGPSSGD